MSYRQVEVSVPGKVTLFGEHAVVYGKPAIVAAIDKRLRIRVREREDDLLVIDSKNLTFNNLIVRCIRGKGEFEYLGKDGGPEYIRNAVLKVSELADEWNGLEVLVESPLPIGGGMGTSAAVAVGTIAASGELFGLSLTKEDISRMAYEVEMEVQKGQASPMDSYITTYGGLVMITPRKGGPEAVQLSAELPLVLGYTPKQLNTGILVKMVRDFKEEYPELIENVIQVIEDLTRKARVLIEKGDLKAVGKLMDLNHGLLSGLQVSSLELERMVYAARRVGAYGVKLAGAGSGGIVVALTEETKMVSAAFLSQGGLPLEVEIEREGVRIE